MVPDRPAPDPLLRSISDGADGSDGSPHVLSGKALSAAGEDLGALCSDEPEPEATLDELNALADAAAGEVAL